MIRRARSEVVVDLAAVNLRHLVGRVLDREHDAAVEVLVPALAQEAELLQPRPQRLAVLAITKRQAQAQRAVGEAQAERFDGGGKAATFQVVQRRRGLRQPLAVVSQRLIHQGHVVGIERQRTRQARHRRLPGHGLRGERRVVAVRQHLECVTERNAVVQLHELNGVARLAADHAMKQPLVRADDEVGRFLVRVERSAPDEVFRAVLAQLHAPAADQRQQVGAALHPLDVVVRNARHGVLSFWRRVSSVIALPMSAQYTAHIQALFSDRVYGALMATKSNLRRLREAAGLSVRELARQIGESNTNVSYWERSGQIPRSDVLAPMAKALGVTVEELLGQPRPKRNGAPGGRLGQVFQEVGRLPRRQQDKIIEVVQALVAQHASQS